MGRVKKKKLNNKYFFFFQNDRNMECITWRVCLLKIVCFETEIVHYQTNLLKISLILNYYAWITTLPKGERSGELNEGDIKGRDDWFMEMG